MPMMSKVSWILDKCGKFAKIWSVTAADNPETVAGSVKRQVAGLQTA